MNATPTPEYVDPATATALRCWLIVCLLLPVIALAGDLPQVSTGSIQRLTAFASRNVPAWTARLDVPLRFLLGPAADGH